MWCVLVQRTISLSLSSFSYSVVNSLFNFFTENIFSASYISIKNFMTEETVTQVSVQTLNSGGNIRQVKHTGKSNL